MFVNNNYHLSFTINNSWFHYRLTDINYVANYLPVVYASLFIFCTWTLFSIVRTSFTKWHFHLTPDPIYTHLSKIPRLFDFSVFETKCKNCPIAGNFERPVIWGKKIKNDFGISMTRLTYQNTGFTFLITYLTFQNDQRLLFLAVCLRKREKL